MWLPALMRIALEVIYILIERGFLIQKYYTLIGCVSIVFVAITVIVSWYLRNDKRDLSTFGYIGAISSVTILSYFQYEYQYVWSHSSFANLYEMGNRTVAIDSITNGKLPVIDYFSAHALKDVITQILYCLIHGDTKGILVDAYNGLHMVVAFIALYFIIRNLFDNHVAVLFVLLFPGNLSGIKWTSVCFVSIAVLMYVSKKPSVKKYILFWISLLFCAFYAYDEGISLGLACIFVYLMVLFFERNWREIKSFFLCGFAVGGLALVGYVIYAVLTDIPILSRVKEWISVSVASSSTWATANFGNPTSFAFLISYFVVPIVAVLILAIVLFDYKKQRSCTLLVMAIVVFAITECLYITRTIVFHNLEVCSGVTGVLLNFVHWTIPLYVLYKKSIENMSEHIRLLSWVGTMIIVIVLEGTIVTHIYPSADSSLLVKGLEASEEWDLRNNIHENGGKERIVLDEETTELVNGFKNVFDTLLSEEQTFIDFANVTSMYMLTERVRPCYVGQSPSLLTDIYSQECFLQQVSEFDCPLAIIGTTRSNYLQQMTDIPHNIRYYKVAEYIYSNYRPLVTYGEFAVWCEINSYEDYYNLLKNHAFESMGYELVDYGYDSTSKQIDENGEISYVFEPYHSYELGMIPYIWANYDEYNAINNNVIVSLQTNSDNVCEFEGSKTISGQKGCYLAFECINETDNNISAVVVFQDSTTEGARFEYEFTVLPGNSQYLIRVSSDYFWEAYNINQIMWSENENLYIQNVRVLEGD